MTKEYQLGLMTEDEAKQAFAQRSVVLLPVGSLEQHGPHLPAATDTIIAERLSLEIAKAVDGIVLPALSYGNSFSWSKGWVSTISLAQGRLAELIHDIGKSIALKGCKYFIIFNGHGSNPPELVIGSKRLKETFAEMEILMVEWWSAAASAITKSRESAAESHSGEFETSIMMYLAPDLVRPDLGVAEFAKNVPELCYQYLIIKSGGDQIKRIQLYDPTVSASGVYGDPAKATKEKGALVVRRVIENTQRVIRELEEIARYG